MSKIKISYCTTVHDEADELDRLLFRLINSIDPEDEIIVQGDQGYVTDEVVRTLEKFIFKHRIEYIEYPLRIGDKFNFARFKNSLFNRCTGDYIFNIDADEYPSDQLLGGIKGILEMNPDADVFRIPRINTVNGIDEISAKSLGFHLNERGWVNWPDYQMRICKRSDRIRWINPVHEILTGYNFYVDFPMQHEYALYHVKNLDRQIKQNALYANIH